MLPQDSIVKPFAHFKHFYDEYYNPEFDMSNFLNKPIDQNTTTKGSYIIVNAGMGCSLYIKCNYNETNVIALFLHSDCQGQYGNSESHDHRPQRDLFIDNYENKTIEFHNLIRNC